MSIQNHSEPGERELEVLIHSIVRHPAMYVGTREFAKVAAFIEGFAFASVDRLNELRDFNRWLTGRLDFPKNWVWAGGISLIYPKSEDALRELGVLFREFKQSTGGE
ncbi:MAG: hypothetical protein IPN69_16450 [Acidobacteria bacterium]|nr:hypothetical protein [Acidobacteriota bacterium]MBK8812302.1 hypothetical protein [Acidobacteriota bacterium]